MISSAAIVAILGVMLVGTRLLWGAAMKRAQLGGPPGPLFGAFQAAALPAGVAMIAAGTITMGGITMFTGPATLSPEERSAIRARYNAELSTVIARCNSEADDLEKQRDAAIAAIAATATVLEATNAAKDAARRDLRAAEQQADDALTTAHQAADRTKEDEQRRAQDALNNAEPEAARKMRSRNSDYEAAYNQALQKASTVANPLEKQSLQQQARAQRDQSLANSSGEYDRDVARANEVWQQAGIAAEETRIRAYDAAEQTHLASQQAAQTAWTRANEAAESAKTAKLRGIPAAASVIKSFDDQERQRAERCEQQKDDVNARMRKELGI